MQYRSYLSLALFAAATACSSVADGPTAVQSPSVEPTMSREGLKPPPPLGSSETSISLDSPSSETPFEFETARRAPGTPDRNRSFSAIVRGRYFANTQDTNGWIAFVSNRCVTASANAKLQYNEKTGKTSGHGTLTLTSNEGCGGIVVLDLSKIEITGGGFGGCSFDGALYTCRQFSFDYDGFPGGFVNVGFGYEG